LAYLLITTFQIEGPVNTFIPSVIVAISSLTLTAGVGFSADAAAPKDAQPRSLFNGKDLEGWQVDVPALDEDPDGKAPFVVRDGMLVSLGKPAGHLITDDEFENYRLEAEYRFAGKPGNCGVLVHASKPRALNKMFPQSLEVQMAHENAGDFWYRGAGRRVGGGVPQALADAD
jgi:hypothetical protein